MQWHNNGDEMSQDSKTMASVCIFITLLIVGFCVILRIQDAKIKRIAKQLQSAKEYCIGKENRLDFCKDLMQKYN